MELAGELDQLAVGLDDRTPLTSAEPAGPPAPGKPWPGFLERFAAAYEAELAAFVSVVRGERANPCVGREALHALRIGRRRASGRGGSGDRCRWRRSPRAEKP